MVVCFTSSCQGYISQSLICVNFKPLAEDTESESLDVFYGLTNYSRFSLKLNNQEYPLDMDLDKVIGEFSLASYRRKLLPKHAVKVKSLLHNFV